MELTDLQSMVDEMLGEKTFSVTEAFHRLLSGEEVLSEESVREFLHSLLFYGIESSDALKPEKLFIRRVLLLVWLFQWILERVLLPGVSLYILLKFVNHLSREEMLGKMAELIETVISWGRNRTFIL